VTEREKLFSMTEYRRVIAWPERVKREWPFLAWVFGSCEPRSLLDVGCGTGEHTRRFGEEGFTAVGIDASADMIADAAALAGPAEGGGTVRYEVCPAAEAGRLPEKPFGGALCLGNTLSFQMTPEELAGFLGGVAAALAPGAPFLLQLLNYERILSLRVRNLPLNFRPLPEEEGDGEIVFLRVFGAGTGPVLDFYPVTLTVEPAADPPVRLRSSRRGQHRAWVRAEVEDALAAAGFSRRRVYGGMSLDTPFVSDESHDLVVVAWRDEV
jgi:SAM-dependent methyltransferase